MQTDAFQPASSARVTAIPAQSMRRTSNCNWNWNRNSNNTPTKRAFLHLPQQHNGTNERERARRSLPPLTIPKPTPSPNPKSQIPSLLTQQPPLPFHSIPFHSIPFPDAASPNPSQCHIPVSPLYRQRASVCTSLYSSLISRLSRIDRALFLLFGEVENISATTSSTVR